jgi:hypothetical protein
MDRKRKAAEDQPKEAGCTNEQELELVGSSEDQPNVVTPHSNQTPSSAKKQRFDDAEYQHDTGVEELAGIFEKEGEATAHDEASAEETYVKLEPKSESKPETDQNLLPNGDDEEEASKEEVTVYASAEGADVKPEPKSENVSPYTNPSPLPDGGSGEEADEDEEADEEDEDQGDEEEEEDSGDTKMGFGKHTERTRREVMIYYYDYVRWARSQESPSGVLACFLEWTNSDEGKTLEGEGQGNEKFTTYSRQHSGKTFRRVAKDDPSYHLRFKYKRPGPDPVIDRYFAWFNRWGPGPEFAEQAHQEYLADYVGGYLDLTQC